MVRMQSEYYKLNKLRLQVKAQEAKCKGEVDKLKIKVQDQLTDARLLRAHKTEFLAVIFMLSVRKCYGIANTAHAIFKINTPISDYGLFCGPFHLKLQTVPRHSIIYLSAAIMASLLFFPCL